MKNIILALIFIVYLATNSNAQTVINSPIYNFPVTIVPTVPIQIPVYQQQPVVVQYQPYYYYYNYYYSQPIVVQKRCCIFPYSYYNYVIPTPPLSLIRYWILIVRTKTHEYSI